MLSVEESIKDTAYLISLGVPQVGDITDWQGDTWSFNFTLHNAFRQVRYKSGWTRGTFHSQEVCYGFPPINVGADYPYDDLLARFYNTIHLFTDWKFDGTSPSFKGKKPVRHHSVRGDVAVRYNTTLVHKRCARWPDDPFSFTIGDLLPYRSFFQGDFCLIDERQDLQLTDVIQRLTGDLSTCYAMPWPENQGYYEGVILDHRLVVTSEITELRILCHYTSHWQNQINATWAVVHRYTWKQNLNPAPENIGEDLHPELSELIVHEHRADSISVGMHFWADQKPVSWYVNYFSQPMAFTVPDENWFAWNPVEAYNYSSPMGFPEGGPRVTSVTGISHSFRHVAAPDISFLRFTKIADSLLGDALPHAAIAATAALDEGTATLGLNMFESAPEFLGVLALVDTWKLAKDAAEVVFYRKYRSGVKRLASTLGVMFEMLCDTRLLYAYVLRPSLGDLKKVREGAESVRHRWFSGGDFSKSPLTGSDTIHVPLELCEPWVNMYLRSAVKVEGHLDPDCLLLKLLPLRAAGMLPSLSLLWAAMPYSFIMDNFINVSNALEAVDTFLQTSYFYRTEVVTATHLFFLKGDADLPDGLLPQQLGVIDETKDDVLKFSFEYRSFYREIYPNIPVVGPSRILTQLYSTRMPSDWMTYGALTYKLFASRL